MKKLMMLLIMGLFLISVVSGAEWDNVKSYDEENKEITVINALGLGADIAKIKLNTGLNYKVALGYQKVAEFEVNILEDYETAFKELELYDRRKDLEKINRNFDYKYKSYVEVLVDEFEIVCTSNETCEEEKSGDHYEGRIIWEELTNYNFKDGDKLTVGIFTNVEEGDIVEWIPNFFGVRIDEWAVWTASLDVGLRVYWAFDDSAGNNLEDSTGTFLNGTLINMEDGDWLSEGCLIENCLKFDGIDEFVNTTFTENYSLSDNFTLSIWINVTLPTIVQDRTPIGARESGSEWLVQGVAPATYRGRFIGGATTNVPGTTNLSDGTWHHLAIVRNTAADVFRLYEDGVNTVNVTDASTANIDLSGQTLYLGANNNAGVAEQFLNVTLDETAIWNRSLTAEEITQLYNDGFGISFNNVVVTLNAPADNLSSPALRLEFNATITSTGGPTLANMTLYTNETGDWEIRNTTNLTGLLDTQTINRTFNNGDIVLWNIEACNVESVCNFADNNRSFFIDSLAPTFILQSPNGTIDLGVVGNNETLNITFTDPHLGSCLFDYNGTNVTLGCQSGVKNSTNFILELNNKNMTIFANDSVGITNVSFISWDYTILEINQTFNNETIEGSQEDFSAVISLKSGESISTALLIYNNSITVGSSASLGDNIEIKKEGFIIPQVSADTNITFNWSIVLSSGAIINLTSQIQEVVNLGLDNCSTLTNQILNITMVDEEEQTNLINTTLEIAIDLLTVDRSSIVVSLSGEFENENPVGICISENITTNVGYSLDAILKYTAVDPDYAIEYFNLVNLSLNNETGIENLTLFDLNLTDSTQFQLTFRGTDFLPGENVLIFVERQYIAENTFKTVELPKTDSNGQTVLHLVRNDIVYNFLAVKDGITLGSFQNLIAFCEDFTIGSCAISLNALTNETNIFNYDSEVGIIYEEGPAFDATTNDVSFSFVSTTGTSKLVLMTVERRDVLGNVSVCSNIVLTPSGTVTCDIGSDLSDTSLFTTINVDGIDWITSNVIIDTTAFGNIGYVVWLLLAIGLLLMFADSKSGVVLSIAISYIAAVSLGLAVGGITGIGSAGIWILGITVLGLWKINKNRPT